MSHLSIATCRNLSADSLFHFSPTAATAAKEALLSTLSNPQYDRLHSCPRHPDLAKDVFLKISTLTEDDFKVMDCGILNQLYRKAMLLVHPDKNNFMDRERAHAASVHLNSARETLRCRNSAPEAL